MLHILINEGPARVGIVLQVLQFRKRSESKQNLVTHFSEIFNTSIFELEWTMLPVVMKLNALN